jgi:membrane associated rhomboid family serine protease
MSQWGNTLSGRGRVTKILIGINVLVYLAQLASMGGGSEQGIVTSLLKLDTSSVFWAPWTLLTYGFLHSLTNFLHIVLNMYSLWIFGEAIEDFLGAKKFVWLYLLSILGGALAYVIFGFGSVVGASGAIFGLMGAYVVILRRLGMRATQMLVLIGINVVIGFSGGTGVANEVHLGGLATGAAVAWYYTSRR